jgi:regulation of enolase protein 1 (concanavalin A-like superfamily)
VSARSIAAVPMSLRWLFRPARWSTPDGASLVIEAGPRTDWFVDPQGTRAPVLNAPALVGDPSGDYLLSARVRVEFAATYDAGALVLYEHERTWAKLCLEYSPLGEPMVVSVVTRGVSDDCNSFVVEGGHLWLRIARTAPSFAFHASTDGERWQLVRHFALDAASEPAVGFEAQSPTGEGCAATFEDIRYEGRRLGDLRGGE